MPIRAVIFDLFDVLFLHKDTGELRTYEAQMGLSPDALKYAMLGSPQFREALNGRSGEEALWRDVAQRTGLDPLAWEMHAKAFYGAVKLNTELVAFIRVLRPRYKTAIISNASPMARQLVQQFHLDTEVDEVIISFEVGATKPFPAIYQLAASRLGVTPPEALFVDDERRFIEGAKAVGMQGVQFVNTLQAIADIQQYL